LDKTLKNVKSNAIKPGSPNTCQLFFYSPKHNIMKTIATVILLITSVFFSGSLAAQDWSLKFDATDDESYVDCGHSESFFPENVTFEVWFYVDEFVPNGNYILATESWTEEAGPMGYSIRFYPDIGVEFVLGLGENEWGIVSTGYDSLDSLEWVHFAGTFDGSLMTVYLNGEWMLDQAINGEILPSDQNLILGEGATWMDRRFTGKMYDLRIWDHARSQEEIAANMNTFLEGDEEGLIANWKMDEGSGSTLNDATGNFPGSIHSGVSWHQLNDDEETGIPGASQSLHATFYPNPSTDVVMIKNQKNNATVFSVYDLTGRMIQNGTLQPGVVKQFNVSTLPNGIYFLHFNNNGSNQTEKLIVK